MHNKPPSWLGRHHTEESKQKISEAQRGVPNTHEHNQKISEAMKGNQNNRKQLRLF